MSIRYKQKRRARYHRVNQSDGLDDNDIIQCWCGATGTYESLFDDRFLDDRCGGTGILFCQCGGDLCVCHNHGEMECLGCEDCEEPADDYEDDERELESP